MNTKAPKHPRYLLWVDLETTGLNPEHDDILEIAYVLTEFRFPFSEVVHPRGSPTRASYLVQGRGARHLLQGDCVEFIRKMHEKSGLHAAFLSEGTSKITLGTVNADLLTLAEDWPTDKDERVMIAGNSCHFDLSFLRKHLPEIAAKLSYRTFDASTFYRGCLSAGMPALDRGTSGCPREEAHRAMADVERSIVLMRTCVEWIREKSTALRELQKTQMVLLETLGRFKPLVTAADANVARLKEWESRLQEKEKSLSAVMEEIRKLKEKTLRYGAGAAGMILSDRATAMDRLAPECGCDWQRHVWCEEHSRSERSEQPNTRTLRYGAGGALLAEDDCDGLAEPLDDERLGSSSERA
jgi:oligoribonuclease